MPYGSVCEGKIHPDHPISASPSFSLSCSSVHTCVGLWISPQLMMEPTWHPSPGPVAGHRCIIREGERSLRGGEHCQHCLLLTILGEMPVDVSHRGRPGVLPRFAVAAGLSSEGWLWGEQRSTRSVLRRNKSYSFRGRLDDKIFWEGQLNNTGAFVKTEKDGKETYSVFLHSGPGSSFSALLWGAEVENSRGKHL